MIYVSTSCVIKEYIVDSVIKLHSCGFRNIELSGGTKYYENIEQDLLDVQKKHDLNFLCHNYFPPPKEQFVINLASTDLLILQKSISNIKKSLNLSQKFGAKKFGFHAGFYFNPDINQLGKRITPKDIVETESAQIQFAQVFNTLKAYKPKVELFIENNVLSLENYQNFGCNPFMLTNSQEYNDLITKFDFKLLLDVAHLKVTCNSLGLDFKKEFNYLVEKAEYIHISDNDGKTDSNKAITKDSEIFDLLSKTSLKGKTITLEIYEEIDKIISSYELLQNIIH